MLGTALLVVTLLAAGSRASVQSLKVERLGDLKCPPCDPRSSICNGTANPFHCPVNAPAICENGTFKGGCATKAAAEKWSKAQCTECCDTSACFAGRTCRPCSSHECKAHYCLPQDPLLCLSGSAIHGCGPNGTFPSWACDECCDRSSCPMTTVAPPPSPAPTTCPKCKKGSWVCNTTTNPYECSPSYPNLCEKGARKGECGTKEMVKKWNGCDECCDTAGCFSPCEPCTAQQCAAQECFSTQDTQTCTTTGACAPPGTFPNWACPTSCCDLSSCNRTKLA